MTQLELLLMKVPGLSEVQAKEVIILMQSLDDLTQPKIEKFRIMLIEKTGLEEHESDVTINLLLQFQESQ